MGQKALHAFPALSGRSSRALLLCLQALFALYACEGTPEEGALGAEDKNFSEVVNAALSRAATRVPDDYARTFLYPSRSSVEGPEAQRASYAAAQTELQAIYRSAEGCNEVSIPATFGRDAVANRALMAVWLCLLKGLATDNRLRWLDVGGGYGFAQQGSALMLHAAEPGRSPALLREFINIDTKDWRDEASQKNWRIQAKIVPEGISLDQSGLDLRTRQSFVPRLVKKGISEWLAEDAQGEESFDLITAVHSFMYIPRKLEVFTQLYRRLRPGGLMLIATSTLPWFEYVVVHRPVPGCSSRQGYQALDLANEGVEAFHAWSGRNEDLVASFLMRGGDNDALAGLEQRYVYDRETQAHLAQRGEAVHSLWTDSIYLAAP